MCMSWQYARKKPPKTSHFSICDVSPIIPSLHIKNDPVSLSVTVPSYQVFLIGATHLQAISPHHI